jgi:predicted AlkP superfamily pyrophosphatase or phosphodiesterase
MVNSTFASHTKNMSATKKVIFYLIDGARPDILKKLAEKGHLPNIQRHLIEEGSFSKGSTCFPSTTGPAYLPYLTGAFPGDHHITGIRWFDKMEYFSNGLWTRNSMRSYCGYEAAYFNDDMDSTLPSLFEEYEDGINLYNMITKGVREENDVTKKGKTGLYFRAHFKHEHHQVDKAGHLHLMDSLHKESRFTFAVFPSIDWDSHTYHFDDPETTHQAYKIADDSLGEVVEQLKARNEYQDTLMIMASDHGLSSTHTHLDLGNFFRSHKYRVMEYPLFFKWRPQVAIFISGNSFATISFLDKKGSSRTTKDMRRFM